MHSYHTIIYAVGGGRGHTVRGMVLGDRLTQAGTSALLLVRRGSRAGLTDVAESTEFLEIGADDSLTVLGEDRLSGRTLQGERIIVDTFPSGWRDQIPLSWLQSFKERVLLARYQRDLDWNRVCRSFTDIWLPYSPNDNEWDWTPPGATFLGLLTKTIPIRFVHHPQALLVYDPESRLSDQFRNRIWEIAHEAGLTAKCVQILPATVFAEKIFVIGAGYNTFYELRSTGISTRFLPIRKRYDDQTRRATRAGLAILSFEELRRWLHDDQ